MSMPLNSFKLGLYEHYKGRFYFALLVAQHSETDEILVVYVPLYIHYEIVNNMGSARPLSMFTEEVRWPDGKMRPRFRYVGPEAKPDDETPPHREQFLDTRRSG